jgi:hypothetical protein
MAFALSHGFMLMRRRLPFLLFLCLIFPGLIATGCGGTSSPTAPSGDAGSVVGSTSNSTSPAAGVTTYTYTSDVRPILTADCTRCHNGSQHEAGYDFTTYPGVMRAVTPGSADSMLVRVVRTNGTMYPNLTGNRSQKAQVITDWVVSSGAAQ